MTLNQIILNRLSFIKYLYQHSVDQSNQPSPQNSASILTFHDAIEIFLQLSVEFLNANPRTDIKFMAYWDIINQKLSGNQLLHKASMIRLNKARVNLKHHGQLINKSDIETFRVNTKDFFEDNTPIIFKIDFSEISLIDLIENEEVKQILKDAQEFSMNRKYKEALERLAIAFDILILDYENSKTYRRKSPFFIGKEINESNICDPDCIIEHELYDIAVSVIEIQKVIKFLCLNIDYRKYAKFFLLTPKIFRASILVNKDKRIYNKYNAFWDNVIEKKLNEDSVEFCFNFIIESALKLQEFDFEMENL